MVGRGSAFIPGPCKPALLLFLACNGIAWVQAVFEVQWAPDLALTDLSQANQRLDAPFNSAVTLRRAGRTLSCANCASLLQSRRSGFEPVSDRDAEAVQSLLVDCLALEALRGARPARTSFLRTLHFGPEALAFLPPGLAPAISGEDRDKVEHAAAQGLSWKQFDPSATASLQGDDLVVLSDDLRMVIRIYGWGDFTGGGIDNLLLRVDAAALHGSYRSSRLFLLTRAASNAPIHIIRELTDRP